MNLSSINNIYFVGIGGIGMSALARYFKTTGKNVAGYDKAETELTNKLINEGIFVHYNEKVELIPEVFKNQENTLVVYTPAISEEHKELLFFRNNGFKIVKRSELLGFITRNEKTIAVAGTHGKTTVSTMIAHLLKSAGVDCTAFLGGISKNFDSNIVISNTGNWVVVEADEFDRSFHQLNPDIAVITSIDPDHLDIYKDFQQVKKSFSDFINCIKPNGKLIIKNTLLDLVDIRSDIEIITYSLNDVKADIFATELNLVNDYYHFTLNFEKWGVFSDLNLGIHGLLNVENAVAASIALLLATNKNPKIGLQTFKGTKRRFEVLFNKNNKIYIDDYAHHPAEISAFLNSVKDIYRDKKILGIFQPHLYSRTKDFYSQFAESLSLLNEVLLLDIYPARELPLKDVTSQIILNEIKNINKKIIKRDQLINELKNIDFDIVVTMGAGDIDKLTPEIVDFLNIQYV